MTPSIFDEEKPDDKDEQPVVTIPYEPETVEESARRSGLAYSAGIVFVASVAFCMFLGWGADLLLGSSPWGLVAGIILGSVIGFLQFFRITSRIFNAADSKNKIKPLLDRSDDDTDAN